MANYFTEFSELVEGLSVEEREWCERRISEIEIAAEAIDGPLGFEYEFEESAERSNLWIHAGESGEPERVAELMSEFIERFRPGDYFTLSWASGCSKPRLSAFHGGAVFITAKEVEWLCSSQWQAERMARFEKIREQKDEGQSEQEPASPASEGEIAGAGPQGDGGRAAF